MNTTPNPPAPTAPPTSSSAYRVQLDAYAGPLDLLLYLVKRHEIDLQDIPIAELTEQYLDHLKVIESLSGAKGEGMDVDRAGEFLVMAATLVEIKSAMLMPRLEARDAEDSEDGENAGGVDAAVDPRFELVQQLLAYKRYKDASLALDERRGEWDVRYPASAKTGQPAQTAAGDNHDENENAREALDLEDVNVLDLCAAFGRMLDAIGFTGDHEVEYDDTPISLHADDIADRLERDGGTDGMTLRQLFVGRRHRSEMIGLFLATLELVRQRRVVVNQPDDGGDIRLQLRPASDRDDLDGLDDQEARDWRNPDTGEVEYDWPDDETRRRAEKRARIRAAHADQGQSPPDDADDSGDDPTPGNEPDPDPGTKPGSDPDR
ncbi:MAG: segregation/condensation protein A [Planctomycetota bacterium]